MFRVPRAKPGDWPYSYDVIRKNPFSAGSWPYPLVMTNVAIENGPVEILDVPMNNGDFP